VDVLHGAPGQAPEEAEKLDLTHRKGRRLAAYDRDRSDRLGAGEQRREYPRAETERDELGLFRVTLLGHVFPVAGLSGFEQVDHHRGREGHDRPGWENRLRRRAGRSEDAKPATLREQDCRPVEGNEPAKLANERGEGLLDLERR
jgi:hypothetical protein